MIIKEPIVTRETLEIYDKYDGDFGLLDERWASNGDRKKVSSEQCRVFGEYVSSLHLIKFDVYSVQMREVALKRIAELEKMIDREVVEVLRKRVLS